jgi:hypothetical protein
MIVMQWDAWLKQYDEARRANTPTAVLAKVDRQLDKGSGMWRRLKRAIL